MSESGDKEMIKEELLEKAKPVLFNTDMVLGILEERKSATRRLVKFLDEKNPDWSGYIKDGLILYNGTNEPCNKKSPYRPGDILYVRETWNFMPCIECRKENETCGKGQITYEDRHSISERCFLYRAGHPRPERFCWHPSIHMPKEAARIFLRVTDVRVEHLQDMRLEDFLEEGVVLRPEAFNDPENAYRQAEEIFQKIWDSTIPEADMDIYGWDADPWVWVNEFERIMQDESST